MEISLIKKSFKKKAIKLVPIFAATLGLFIFANGYSSSNTEKLKTIEDSTRSISSQISSKQEEYEKSEKDYNAYKAVNKNKLPTKGGYAVGRYRLKTILPIIKDLKDKYSFNKLSFSLSEIKKGQAPDISNFDLFQNDIVIDFSAASDELLFSFINDLKILLPGYLNIQSLKIVRENEVDEAAIKNYLDGTGSIVTGNVNIEWSTLGLPVDAQSANPDDGQRGPMMGRRP